jgi:hypothetical protein
VLKLIFLVGDAPPHMDYGNAPKYPEVCEAAAKKDLIINTVQCGGIAETTPVWKEIAKLAEGNYAAIEQSGGMVAVATPMDDKLAELNRKLGGTMVAYGSDAARRSVAAKQMAAEAAPAAVAADRLKYNLASGVSVQGGGELLDGLTNGTVKLETLKRDQLPPEWQKLDDKELRAAIEAKQKERADLQSQITKLSRERDNYIAAERKKLADSSRTVSFDDKVAQTIRAQAAKKGIDYGAE